MTPPNQLLQLPNRGYLTDAFVDSQALPESPFQDAIDGQAYRIWHWSSIDTFVYFSHQLASIPPRGWTEAAHTHGTKVTSTLACG